ncbi:MAG: FGGY-family carbohydrate kinase, partial [Actinomycetota bacterium]|nr:FGGY-family carbohydrate kinase [Actinomycetota bacterium]
LADGLDALRENGVPVGRVLLIGGAARSATVQEVAAGIFGAPVEVPSAGEYVAVGAARQAAWALLATGGAGAPAEPPTWSHPSRVLTAGGDWAPEVRGRYQRLRRQVHRL